MKTIILFASVTIASGLILVNMHTSLVDARSWGSNIPDSIAVAREYFKTVNPGNFFRVFSPINQLLGLLAEGLTFRYFYPRNDIMFKTADLTDTSLLKKTWAEWNTMNWVRTLVLVIGLICSFISLRMLFRQSSK